MQRWLKFAKLLPEHGWDPVVVTPSNPDVPVHDASLSEDVPEGLEVWKFPVWEPTRSLRKLGLGGGASRLGAEPKSKSSPLSRFVKWVRGNLFVPDARIGWVNPTVRRVLKHAQNRHFDLLLTTGPPHSVHLIGLALQQKLGLTWVADFRDPWSTMDYLADFRPTTRTQKRIQAMERRVVNAANEVFVTSPRALSELSVPAGKGRIVPNGWDRDDFPHGDVDLRPVGGRKVLGHFGALYGARNPRAVWDALEFTKDTWALRLAGPVTPQIQEELRARGVTVEWMGDLDHRHAVAEMKACDALLVSHNNSPSAQASTPGKVFECMATGRPLVVVGPAKSDLEDRCREWDVPFIAHDDPDAPQRALDRLRELETLEKGQPSPPTVALRFERHALVAELASALNSVTSSP